MPWHWAVSVLRFWYQNTHTQTETHTQSPDQSAAICLEPDDEYESWQTIRQLISSTLNAVCFFSPCVGCVCICMCACVGRWAHIHLCVLPLYSTADRAISVSSDKYQKWSKFNHRYSMQPSHGDVYCTWERLHTVVRVFLLQHPEESHKPRPPENISTRRGFIVETSELNTLTAWVYGSYLPPLQWSVWTVACCSHRNLPLLLFIF